MATMQSGANSRMDVGALLFGKVRREHQLRCAVGVAALAEPCQQRQQVVLVSLDTEGAWSERRCCSCSQTPAFWTVGSPAKRMVAQGQAMTHCR